MKKKGGAIILEVTHQGTKNAKKVIDSLERQGVKEGDLVAVEFSKEALSNVENRIKSGRADAVVDTLIQKLKSIEQEKRKGELTPEVNNQKNDLIRILERVTFEYFVFSYLIAKKVKFLPMESNAVARRAEEHLQNIDSPNKKQRAIESFLRVPVREKLWKKKLKNEKPRFVIAGTGHAPALKRMLAYEQCINLSDTKGWKRIKQMTFGEYVRAKYKLIQTKKRVRRKFIRKQKTVC